MCANLLYVCLTCRETLCLQHAWHITPPLLPSAHTRSHALLRAEGKPSWTARLLADPALLCSKVREEAGELAQALEQHEGKERVASEAADLLYHAMVLLRAEGVAAEDVLRVLRQRFGTSGIAEKAARGQQPRELQQQ